MKAGQAAVKPYARALYELARERQQTEAVARDLDAMVEVVAGDTELRAFFSGPWVPAAAKRTAAMEVASRLDLLPLVRDFLGLVARGGRAQNLAAIAAAFHEMVDRDLGQVRARVRTRVPLSDGERDSLRVRLGAAMGGKRVIMHEDVDPYLLGGFVAEIGSYIMDGSLDGQLARIEERLKRA